MSLTAVRQLPSPTVPDYVPAEWGSPPSPSQPQAGERDVALDLLRGLAIVVLVVNHLRLASPLSFATGSVISAAEILVAVSGVVIGMVFGRRWLAEGALATTATLLRRSRKLYVASVCVVGLVGVLTLIPGLATDALAISPTMDAPRDMYEYDGLPRTVLAVVTLEAGPWQFNILGYFIASLALAPLVLFGLARGRWLLVVGLSLGAYAVGHFWWHADILPFQSERPFPILVWQVIFVNAMVIGWHRHSIAAALRRRYRPVAATVISLGVLAAGARLAGPEIWSAEAWDSLEARYFNKGSLDLLRVLGIASMAGAIYIAFRHLPARAARAAGALLLPLGRSSFYVFIVHVFLCLAVATAVSGTTLGPYQAVAIQVAVVLTLWLMAKHRLLFSIVPR